MSVCVVVAGAMLAPAFPAAAEPDPEPTPRYVDVKPGHWADDAVTYTAEDREWLRFGGAKFRPGTLLKRWQLARAAVRAFAPDHPVDPELTFDDLTDEPMFGFANVAVSLKWFPRSKNFRPDGTVSKRLLSRVLVRALGLTDAVTDLSALSTDDGYRFRKPKDFAYLVLANELKLHPNFPSPKQDTRDLYPWESVNRGYAAVALHNAATAGWRTWNAQRFEGITLPTMNAKRRQIVEFAFRYVGYPYIYAGEWHRPNASQPKGGFDCSGFQWWVAKRPGGGFDNTHVRPYRGFDIQQRRASLIAKEAPRAYRFGYKYLKPGDLVFFATGWMEGNWRDIDHGGVALGNGWMIHSTGIEAGVTITRIGDGWWRDAFVMGRRVLGKPPVR